MTQVNQGATVPPMERPPGTCRYRGG